jgi:hypothetical protein
MTYFLQSCFSSDIDGIPHGHGLEAIDPLLHAERLSRRLVEFSGRQQAVFDPILAEGGFGCG